MKITKSYLKQVIKEEMQRLIEEETVSLESIKNSLDIFDKNIFNWLKLFSTEQRAQANELWTKTLLPALQNIKKYETLPDNIFSKDDKYHLDRFFKMMNQFILQPLATNKETELFTNLRDRNKRDSFELHLNDVLGNAMGALTRKINAPERTNMYKL